MARIDPMIAYYFTTGPHPPRRRVFVEFPALAVEFPVSMNQGGRGAGICGCGERVVHSLIEDRFREFAMMNADGDHFLV